MSIKMLLMCLDIPIRIKREIKLLKEEMTALFSEDIAVMPPLFNTAACRMFKAATKLVDFGDDAVQKWTRLLGWRPEGSVTDGRDEGAACQSFGCGRLEGREESSLCDSKGFCHNGNGKIIGILICPILCKLRRLRFLSPWVR